MNHKFISGTILTLDFVRDIIAAVLAALLLSQFVMAHTTVPTGSMIPTINIDDHMLINYLPYYYRDPEVGEIIVFKHGDANFVKRVIAGPGDTIDLNNGFVYLNGERLDEVDYVREFGTTYPLVLLFPYTVPEGQYFVMGDNRTNSDDSRVFGTVDREDIFATPLFKFRVERLQ